MASIGGSVTGIQRLAVALNNTLQWDAHGVASLRRGSPRLLRSLGAPERER